MVLVLLLLPPIHQDPAYHQFADQRTIWGIPNFSNVVSNLPFLLIALWGLPALTRGVFATAWERTSYGILLAGVGLVAFGSAYYHANPNQATLFWDRLPMTVAFMSLLATTIGERISLRAGQVLLPVLLTAGAASVLYWRATDDLRLYVMVQFFPLVAMPLMWLLFPPRYTDSAGLWELALFYALAKILETADRPIAAVVATGGHPWKHIAGAVGIGCYLRMMRCRRKVIT